MRWRSEYTLLGLIEQCDSQIAALAERASKETTVELDEELVSATVEMQELQNELEFVRKQESGSDESASLVRDPLKPLPSPNSAGIALPEPSDFQFSRHALLFKSTEAGQKH